MAFDGLREGIKNKNETRKIQKAEPHVTLTVVAGKEFLNMKRKAETIVMRQNSDGYIYFDTMPERFFEFSNYSWDGPKYKSVSSTTGKEKTKSKEKGKSRHAGVGAGAIGPGVAGGGIIGGGRRKGKGHVETDMNSITNQLSEEIDSIGSIQLKDIETGKTFSFGFNCNSKIDIELDGFDWSAMEESSDEEVSDAAVLKKYKDMLDQGLITEADYEAKKMQILGL